MAKKSLTSKIFPSTGLPVLRFPFEDLPADKAPGHPRNLRVSLSPTRRRKLHAIYAGLKRAGATIAHGRGGQVVQKPVYEFGHAILWLLDNAEFLDKK